MFCPKCGKEIENTASFCPSCGAKLNDSITNQKSKIAAGLLGLFLGTLGIHNFYLGYTAKGLIQLILTIVGAAIFPFISGAVAIWAFVEAILIFCGQINDASGNPLR